MARPFGPASPVRPATLAQVLWYKFAWGLAFGLCWLVWRVSAKGRENVPRTGAFIVAPVHRSYLDTLLAGYVTSRPMRYMAKEEIFSKPWAAKLFSSLGGFAVRRGTPDRDALRQCEQVLASGEPLVLFPEGTRRSGPVVEDLFGGAAWVALRANVPIVPVGIGGSDKAMPPGAKMLGRSRIVMVIGPPLWPPPRTAAGRVPRKAVEEMTGRLQVELQAVYDEAAALAAAQMARA